MRLTTLSQWVEIAGVQLLWWDPQAKFVASKYEFIYPFDKQPIYQLSDHHRLKITFNRFNDKPYISGYNELDIVV